MKGLKLILIVLEVLLEAACFAPEVIARTCRKTLLASDSAYRFERGVDIALGAVALNRVASLLESLAGARVIGDKVISEPSVPKKISLAISDINKLLGFSLESDKLNQVLTALNCKYKYLDGVWQVRPPSYRYDLNITADLVEEVLRLVGFDALPISPEQFSFAASVASNSKEHQVRFKLSSLGLHEHIGYSFVAAKKQQEMFGLVDDDFIRLANPMSKDMDAMRVSCWPGLVCCGKI